MEQKKSLKILMFDDGTPATQVLCAALEYGGYDLVRVREGTSLLINARSIMPDVILMDTKMPLVNGISACKRLKEDTKTKDIPVIFCSSDKEKKIVAEAYSAGCEAYIVKPIFPKDLCAKMSIILAGKNLKDFEVQL